MAFQNALTAVQQTITARKSIVQVFFPDREITLAYYNDLFDLHCGDIVFVEGKLEGFRGRILDVNYNFKIKMSDYKRVISVADTNVHGQFYMAGSHFVTFCPDTLSRRKVATWFIAPPKEDDEFISGSDDSRFRLADLKGFNVSKAVADRGHEYYIDNKVVYLCVDSTKGYAIVEGTHPYEVEFNYSDGEISELVCSCYCSYNCKHEMAAMLQLRETLELIKKNYAEKLDSSSYFAAIRKSTLFGFAIDGKDTGSFTLQER